MEITDENMKPIPKYILQKIRQKDKQCYPCPYGYTRFYAYLTKIQGELTKVTVAVKHHRKKWYCKAVAWHGVHSERCYLKDIEYNYMSGYRVGWYEEGLQRYRKLFERGVCYAADNYYDPWAQIVNLSFIEKYPEYKYSGYKFFQGVNLFKFLRLYEKYPQIEYMVKSGLHNYATSVTILKHIGKDKAFTKWLIRNKEELNKPCGGYYVDTVMEAYKTNRPFQEVQDFLYRRKCFIREGNRNYAPICQLFPGRKLKTFFEYIDEKKIKPALYLDYLNACNYLKLDMSLRKNILPHDFMRWHDIRIDQYATAKAHEDESTRPDFYAKFLSVANKYLPLQLENQSNFICIIAKSPGELIREGGILNHCVGTMNYDQKVIREESLIFFVREAGQPDKPFVTIEYSLKSHKILQSHAFDNRIPDVSAFNYINNIWLPYANKALKKIAA